MPAGVGVGAEDIALEAAHQHPPQGRGRPPHPLVTPHTTLSCKVDVIMSVQCEYESFHKTEEGFHMQIAQCGPFVLTMAMLPGLSTLPRLFALFLGDNPILPFSVGEGSHSLFVCMHIRRECQVQSFACSLICTCTRISCFLRSGVTASSRVHVHTLQVEPAKVVPEAHSGVGQVPSGPLGRCQVSRLRDPIGLSVHAPPHQVRTRKRD